MEIKVTNCQECPFANNDNESGFHWCNLADSNFDMAGFEQLPADKVHDLCPLKNGSVTLSL